ncbi:MAG: hypothetical protein P1V20_05080 [Verrucomicrobiales bacterium]|nr:hypothetical protein [Verrucomicrobiales bacterium]
MNRPGKICLKTLRTVLIFVTLTLLTQVGGIIWLCIRKIGRRFSEKRKIQIAINAGIYLMIILTVVPILARIGGRVALPIIATKKTPVEPRSFLFVIFNRHYVKPDARDTLIDAARDLSATYPGSVVHYLDGGFPFFDKFPMLPHLSHSRGEAVDVAFMYHAENDRNKYLPCPSMIGYWLYEGPKRGEYQPYRSRPSKLRWDFEWLQFFKGSRRLDRERTRYFIRHLLEDSRTSRMLLEAHLHRRWGIVHHKLRFQQLNAARHDDHLHLWVKQR